MEKIDFVLTWVDGSDPQWLAEKRMYDRLEPKSPLLSADSDSECRYRDFGFLKYWFRGVELFAPWVNKVYFVTCGQKPAWLDANHPKLVCVHHRDFIPGRFLPTFNSNTIELNLHRIQGLSEQFVLFNDDVFLLNAVSPSFFFRDGNPVLHTTLRLPNYFGVNNWSRVSFNNFCLIHEHFKVGDSIWKNRKKWFSVSQLGPRKALRNYICYLAYRDMPVGHYGHVALPHLKSTMADVWEKCSTFMEVASTSKFRRDNQVNQWLFCAWDQALGKFYPSTLDKLGLRIEIAPEYADWIVQVMTERRIPVICLNDNVDNTDASVCAQRIISAFDQLFPRKSSFELEG